MRGVGRADADQSTADCEAAMPLPEAARCPQVLVLYHRGRGQLVEVHPGTPVVVGRAFPADVMIPEASLSRQHARFSNVEGAVHVEDLGSRNGTLVGSQKIEERRQLRPGESVLLGDVVVTVQALIHRHVVLHELKTYDEFLAALDGEVLRAREFGRPVAVLALRAADAARGHASEWCAGVRARLRAVDQLASYGPDSMIALLPEIDGHSAERSAAELRACAGGSVLFVGYAVFPQSGTSSGELVANALDAMRAASHANPIVAAAGEDANRQTSNRAIVAGSAMQEVFRLAQRVATTTAPVLIQGETGTGKEIVATSIHHASPRKAGPLRIVNCAAIPQTLMDTFLFGHERGAFTGASETRKGVFEQAQGGTLFLDEIAELSPAAQAALLRAIETKRITRIGGAREIEVDARIVAATHCNLEAMVESGRFRSDLFFRLNTLVVALPPLRQRPEEVADFVEHFMRHACEQWARPRLSMAPSALAALESYDYPGNVRELRNIVERALTIAEGKLIELADLPERVQRCRASNGSAGRPSVQGAAPALVAQRTPENGSYRSRVKSYETALILDALRIAGGNKTRASEILGMPIRTLTRKMSDYGIKGGDEGV